MKRTNPKEKAINDVKSEYIQYMMLNIIAMSTLVFAEYAYGIYRSFYGIPYTLIIYMIAFKLNSRFYKGILYQVSDHLEKTLHRLEQLEESKRKKK